MENIQDQNRIEHMEQPKKRSPMRMFISFFWTLVTFFAIFLSFKCNGGFDFGGFLAACCCGPFYVAYKLGVDMDACFPGKIAN